MPINETIGVRVGAPPTQQNPAARPEHTARVRAKPNPAQHPPVDQHERTPRRMGVSAGASPVSAPKPAQQSPPAQRESTPSRTGMSAEATPMSGPEASQQKALPQRERTASELAELEEYLARKGAMQFVRLKAPTEEDQSLKIDHPDQEIGLARLMNAMGTADPNFLSGLVSQLADIASIYGDLEEGQLNFMLSVIKGIKPRHELMAMLGAQMAAIHLAFMKLSRGPSLSKKIPQLDSAPLNKLARTFVMQLEALHRYQTGGPQTVQNVSINCDTRSIVANVTQPASETPPRMTDGSPLLVGEKVGVPLPTDAGHQRLNGGAASDTVQPADDEGERRLRTQNIRLARRARPPHLK